MHIFGKTIIVMGLVIAGTVLAAGTADAPKANLQQTMLTKVNPNGLAFWDITNNAQGDDGNVDPKKLKPSDWARLVEIGKAIEDGGRTLATSNGIIAAAPGAKLQDEGPASSKAADVQRFLDAKPAVFRTRAQELQKTGAAIADAATKKDGKRLSDLAGSLDEVCEKCHVIFWYPQQQKK